MSLRVWLPLNGDLRNNGLSDVEATAVGTTINNNGKIGKCYEFSTGGSYITLPKEVMNSFDNECTLCFWIKIISWNASYATFFQAGTDYYAWKDYIFGVLRSANDSKLAFTVGNATTSTSNSNVSSDLELNKWYHMAFRYDNRKYSIWINGELYSEFTTSINCDFSKITNITIGRANTSGVYQSNCDLNDLRIYDHALSEKEIKKISQGLILHYALNRNGFGQENLMKNSSRKLDNAGYYVGTYAFANPSELVTGEKYTFSFSGELQDPSQTGWYFNIFPSPYPKIGTVSTTEEGCYSFTFTMPENGGNRTSIGCYSTPLGNYKGCAIWNVKLEKGEKATPWCPNLTDTEYTTLGLDDNIEYDLSGYNRNATRTNGVTYNSDSPKYNVSSVFNGTSTSYIKCNTNDWMIPMTELTISCWCYMDDWTQFSSYGRLWSCTEGGGFGVYWENNQMEFPISASPRGYLPTIARCGVTLTDLTSGWHMFTFIYTTIGTKVYIDGNLYKSYEINSDYVNYNTGVKLFLGCEAASSSLPTSPYFKGKMSDFRIYATALSQADIAELYSIHRS